MYKITIVDLENNSVEFDQEVLSIVGNVRTKEKPNPEEKTTKCENLFIILGNVDGEDMLRVAKKTIELGVQVAAGTLDQDDRGEINGKCNCGGNCSCNSGE